MKAYESTKQAVEAYNKALAAYKAAREDLIATMFATIDEDGDFANVMAEPVIKLIRQAKVRTPINTIRVQWIPGKGSADVQPEDKELDFPLSVVKNACAGSKPPFSRQKLVQLLVDKLLPAVCHWLPREVWCKIQTCEMDAAFEDLASKMVAAVAASELRGLKEMGVADHKFAQELRQHLDEIFVKEIQEK